MLFASIPGLIDVKSNLLNAIKKGKVPHAQLFFSNNGGANLAMALAYGTYLNCENRQENDACGVCAACSKNLKLVHPDFHFVVPVATSKSVDKSPTTANYMKEWRHFATTTPYATINEWGQLMGIDNKQPTISADEARNITKKITLKAFEGPYKILMIWLPEYMNVQGANAILKILEEPPVNTVFLLVVNQHDKLLTTILSRTQKVLIRGFHKEELQQYLIAEHQCDAERAEKIAFIADGNIAEAISLVNEEEEQHEEMFRNWMRKCFTYKIVEVNDIGDEFQKIGREAQKLMLQYGISILRECVIMLHEPILCRLRASEKEFVEKFSKITQVDKIEAISSILEQAYKHVERNANPKILFFDISLKISMILISKQP